MSPASSTNKDINSESIQHCWFKIKSAKGVDVFADYFYKTLFSKFPDTKALFPDNLVQQKLSLLTTLDNVINGIDYIDDLKKELFSLGKHHENIGITKGMFDAFIITIVASAIYASDDAITVTELGEWEKGFRAVSDIMIEAYA